MKEISNRKNTYIVQLCVFWCYQSFNIIMQGNEQRKSEEVIIVKKKKREGRTVVNF